MAFFIGLDVGTSSTKAVLINQKGEVVYTTAPAYNFSKPKPSWAESDPADWWQATRTAIAEILQHVEAKDIAGIGMSGQMHGLVLLDEKGSVLRPCIMWNDQRTAAQCAEITAKVGAAKVLEITGNPVLTGFTAPKIVWVQQNEPDVWARARHILLPKDYIRYCLSGDFATDVSDASGMSLLNVGERKWSPEMLQACGVGIGMMPRLLESTEVSGQVSAAGASATGLLEGTPIIAGGGDQAAGAVGCGIVRSGVVSCTLGTSGVLFAHADSYNPDPQGRLHTFCAAVPGKWHFMGVQLSCAGSYQWYHDEMGGGASFPELNELAAKAPAGSEGLFFLPYLSGERTPHPDPDARGVFFGISLRHGKAHMTRAVMEGVTYGLRDALEIMRELGLSPRQIVASGGGAKSLLWKQMLADCFESTIVTVNATEGAAFGAALLAAVGSGHFDSVESACDAMLLETGRVEQGSDSAAYNAFYPVYRDLYPALKSSFAKAARVVEQL